jgi:hypothetical protein
MGAALIVGYVVGLITCKVADKFASRPWFLSTRPVPEDSKADQGSDSEPFRLFSIIGGKEPGFDFKRNRTQNSSDERSEKEE